MMGIRGVSSPSSRWAFRTPSLVVTLGIMNASGGGPPARAAASRRPSSDSGSLTRTMMFGLDAVGAPVSGWDGIDISAKRRATDARAPALRPGATASSRSMHTASAPAASAFA